MDKYYDSAMHFHESNRKFDPIIFIQFAVNRSLVCEKLKFNRSWQWLLRRNFGKFTLDDGSIFNKVFIDFTHFGSVNFHGKL